MKKNFIIISTLIVANLLTGCSRDVLTQNQSGFKEVTFRCTPESKVVLNPTAGTLDWSSSAEYLGVYSFTAGEVDEQTTKTGAKFTKAAGSKDFTGSAVEDAVKAYAIYPFYYAVSSVASATETAGPHKCTSAGVFTTVLAQAQTLVKNGINASSNIAVCDATINSDGSLSGTMKNACSYLKFTIGNSGTRPIRQILIESVNNSKLSGLMTVSFDELGNPVAEGMESTYVLGYSSMNTIDNGTYYMTILPGDFTTMGAEGLHVVLSATDGEIYEFTTNGFVAQRNNVYDLGTIDIERPAKQGMLSVFLNPNVTKFGSSSESTYKTVTCEGYQFGYVQCRQWGTGTYLFKEGGLIVSPAIEGKALKKVNVVFDGHESNNCAQVSIRYSATPSTPGTVYMTGTFFPESSVKDNRALKLYLTTNTACKYFHQLRLGHNGNREQERNDLTPPLANTSYQIYISKYNSLVSGIEFVYESALE
ncbi:MAG: hypothetical protein MJY80_04450 [Bacteroidales bacterium]|nr:hypothetical protein [Bacteroidales bacterium]